MAASAVLLLLAVILPAVYRFGRQKGAALTMYPLMALLGAALLWGQENASEALAELLRPTAFRFLLSVGAHLASIPVSVLFYTRRQRGWYD